MVVLGYAETALYLKDSDVDKCNEQLPDFRLLPSFSTDSYMNPEALERCPTYELTREEGLSLETFTLMKRSYQSTWIGSFLS